MTGPGYRKNRNRVNCASTPGGLMAAFAGKAPPQLWAALMLGAAAQMGQVLFLRELLMVFHGNELSIGLALAAWLAWVGAGSRLGAVLAGRVRRPLPLLAAGAAALTVMLPATVLLIRGLRRFFDVLPGAYLSLPDIAVASVLLMAPACLLLGMLFVLLSRVWRESDGTGDTSGAGKTYVTEAAGNMLGGLLFTFLVVHYFNSFQAAVLAGALMLSAVLVPARVSAAPGWRPVRLSLSLAVLLPAVLLVPFLGPLDEWAYRLQWRHFAPQHRLVETYQSKHGTIAVLQRADQYSFFQSGHLVFSTAGPEAGTPGLEEQEAVQFAHLAMVQHPRPERVLLIGGGLRGTLGAVAAHPVTRIDYVELDEVLTKAAKPYVSAATRAALADPRVNLVHGDGRLYVKGAREKYDLIIVDVPDPVTAVLNRFYTEEFFREAANLLNPGGVLVTGTVSTPDLRGLAVVNRNAAVYHTLRGVFSCVLAAGDRFMFYFASDEPGRVSVDPSVLYERYWERDIAPDDFSPGEFYSLLQEPQLRRVNWILHHHGRSAGAHLTGPGAEPLFPGPLAGQECVAEDLPPVERRYFVNSDLRPIGYYYTLMFWEGLTHREHGGTLGRLLHIQPWWILPLCAAPLVAVTGLRFAGRGAGGRRDAGFAVLFAVFTTGLSTMALQIALLFSFQSIYGFVYETVGLIVAMFMGGLALGASLVNRFVAHKAALRTLAAVQLLIALLAVLIALALPRAAAVQFPAAVFALFSLMTFAAGLINGVDFPLTAACYAALGHDPDRSAGAVYGVELFGACAGAILAGTLVAPVLGIAACCFLAGMANLTAFAVLLLTRR